jgi:hypothetical protein
MTLERYAGPDAHLAPQDIYVLRLHGRDYLIDLGARDFGDKFLRRQRVFGWVHGYPACCVAWFIGWVTGAAPDGTLEGGPPQHPVSGHWMCPDCAHGPPAPLPYRPLRDYGWISTQEPGDYTGPGS